jgi:hypothetical protein
MYLGAGGGANVSIGLHQLLADWGEGAAGSANTSTNGGGQGFAAGVGDATWAARFHSPTTPTLWTAPGAMGDFDPTASASANIAAAINSPFQWLSTSALVADVQGWLDNPAMNFGWALVNTSEGTSGSVRAFYSSEATQNSATGGLLDPAWRPTLIVSYVPEPSTFALLLIGLLSIRRACGRRHRRRCLTVGGVSDAERNSGAGDGPAR